MRRDVEPEPRLESGGRKVGSVNKPRADLKEAILDAAELAHKEGLVGYLRDQAKKNGPAFLALIGKVIPKETTVAINGEHVIRIGKEFDKV
jgi:hypothetical protein